jgi:hypothetical protein
MMDQADDQEDDSLPPWDPLGEAAAGIEFETAVRDYRMSQALVQALDDHCEALEQFALWQWRCVEWTRAHGLRVWRERHASDLQKLRMRRRWKLEAQRTADRLRYALVATPAAGRA